MCNKHQTDRNTPSVGTAKETTIKKDCPTAPNPSSPPEYKSTRGKQCNLIKTYHKKFQDGRQVNELCTTTNDSGEELNNFISEFQNIMLEDSDDSSAWLALLATSGINEVFIEGYHTIHNIQVYDTYIKALFDTGASINALSFKFLVTYSNMLHCYLPAVK